jgi:virginiamycin B lyase
MATWKQIAGGLSAISVGSRTNVWGVNTSGEIWRYTGDIPPAP